MLISRIKTDPSLILKPNPYLADPGIPYLYQRRGALMMVARPRMVLGDDVGLGKTIETIVALSYLKAADPGLRIAVFTEKAAVFQWADEFAWVAPKFQVEPISVETHSPSERIEAWSRSEVCITNYRQLYENKDRIRLALGGRYIVIYDEPPFRNEKAEISLQCKELALEAQRAYGLTATLIEGHLGEAFGIYNVLVPGLWKDRKFFDAAYLRTEPAIWVTDPVTGQRKGKPWPRKLVGYQNLQSFKERIEPVFYGRLQSNPEVAQELPEVIVKTVQVPMNEAQAKSYVEAEQGLLRLPEGTIETTHLTALIRCQQIVDHPGVLGLTAKPAKFAVLLELLRGSLYGHQALVFSKLEGAAARLLDDLQKATSGRKDRPIRADIISGKTRQRRDALRKAFQAGELDTLFLTRAGGRALNLQAGGHLFLYDTPWTYGFERQLIGRIKRTGSKHKRVFVWRFLSTLPNGRQTIDHHCLRHVQRGERLFNSTIGIGTEDSLDFTAAHSSIIESMRGGEVELD